jgi:hypothetical protein
MIMSLILILSLRDERQYLGFLLKRSSGMNGTKESMVSEWKTARKGGFRLPADEH